MNNNVSVEGTESIANELKEIASILKDDYDSISMTITKINENINTLKSWNGSDTVTEPYPSKIELSPDNFHYEKLFYKYIWDINITNESSASTALSSPLFRQTEENLDLLDMKSDDLNLLASTLYGFITTLGSLLQVDFDGSAKNFFNSIKNTAGWLETKKIAEEAIAQKEVDELYLKFRSTDGNDDYVDFFLDELGNRRYPQGLPGVDDDGTYPDK